MKTVMTTQVQALVTDKNPLNGVTPNIGVFGTNFTTKTGLILGGVWGFVLAAIAAYMLLGCVKWARARRSGMSEEVTHGAEQMKTAAISFGIAVAAPTILGGIIFLAS